MMPRGYPDTVTCKNCGEGQPADFIYCPCCGAKLPTPRFQGKQGISLTRRSSQSEN